MTINAVTPAVYTDKDGNKLTKDKDGKFHKDDGTEVAAADVITSIQDATGNTTGGPPSLTTLVLLLITMQHQALHPLHIWINWILAGDTKTQMQP